MTLFEEWIAAEGSETFEEWRERILNPVPPGPLSLPERTAWSIRILREAVSIDYQKFARRQIEVATAMNRARAGEAGARDFLRAVAGTVPLPESYQGVGMLFPAGWDSHDWGSAYQPIKVQALAALANLGGGEE